MPTAAELSANMRAALLADPATGALDNAALTAVCDAISEAFVDTVVGGLTDVATESTLELVRVALADDGIALPGGASTSALQTTGNASLASILAGLGDLATAAFQTTGNASLAAIEAAVTGVATQATLAAINAKIPASPSAEHTTAASPNAARLSDGAAFYDAAKTGQLPAALISNRLDVNVGAALPAGTNNIGDVDVVTLPALVAGTALIGNVKISDGVDTALVTAAGEQNVLATAQPGVDIGDVTVNNAAGAAAVNIQDGGNVITVDGTVAVTGVATAANQATEITSLQLIDDVVHAVGDAPAKVVAIGAVRDDAAPASASEDTVHSLRMSSVRSLLVTPFGTNNALHLINDNGGFTDGNTNVAPVGFILDEVAGTALTENDVAAARIDSKRAQIGVIEDAATRGQRAAVSAAGRLSVDASGVTITADTELPAAAALADATANPTAPAVASHIMGWNGATWDRVITSSGRLSVNLGASSVFLGVQGAAAHDAAASSNPLLNGLYASATAPADVSANGDVARVWGLRNGTQTVNLRDSAGAELGTAGNPIRCEPAGATTQSVSLDAAGIPFLSIIGVDDHDASASENFPVKIGGIARSSAPTAVAAADAVLAYFDLQGRLVTIATGDTAHDAADAGSPVKVGGKAAVSALPTAVANNDRTNLATDRYGRALVVPVDIGKLTWKVIGSYTTAQTGSAIWTPTGGNRIVLTRLRLNIYGTTTGRVTIFFSASGDTTYTEGTDQVIDDANWVPSAYGGCDLVLSWPQGMPAMTTDHILRITTDANISVRGVAEGYEVTP